MDFDIHKYQFLVHQTHVGNGIKILESNQIIPSTLQFDQQKSRNMDQYSAGIRANIKLRAEQSLYWNAMKMHSTDTWAELTSHQQYAMFSTCTEIPSNEFWGGYDTKFVLHTKPTIDAINTVYYHPPNDGCPPLQGWKLWYPTHGYPIVTSVLPIPVTPNTVYLVITASTVVYNYCVQHELAHAILIDMTSS